MGWHTNRLDLVEDELLRKDEEIAELKRQLQRLREELVAHHVPYCAELEDQKRMHQEET